MSTTQDAWKEVASKAEGLGLKLKLHLDQENDETSDKQPGETESAVADLSKRLQDAFDAFGRAAKDPAVHADVKNMGTSIFNAMSVTFDSVGARVSDAARSASGQSSGSESADDSTVISGPEAAASVDDDGGTSGTDG